MDKEVYGAELKSGDVMKVWWKPGRDTIISFEEYTGAYKNHAGWEGARIANFAVLKTGMPILPGELHDIIVPD